MFFITLILVLTFWSYLYEKEEIDCREELFSFLYYHGMCAALVAAFISATLLGIAKIYTDVTDEAPIPTWVFVPFNLED
ncbi:MAG: hypothetical protein IKJ58_02330 [Akkermansia sp.]|nr:hypothetical protein [Akkermansia sp.]